MNQILIILFYIRRLCSINDFENSIYLETIDQNAVLRLSDLCLILSVLQWYNYSQILRGQWRRLEFIFHLLQVLTVMINGSYVNTIVLGYLIAYLENLFDFQHTNSVL